MARSEWTDGMDILDLVHESIFARDRDLRITFWNAAAEELYGWKREEALGRNADELLRCVHPLSLKDRESQLFATGRWQGEFGRRTKSGSEILVDATWSVRRNAAGEPIEVVETGRDVTEQRAAEKAIRPSDHRFRNRFEARAVASCEIDPANPDSVNTVGTIDVSELNAATTALARSELKYRDLFNYMPLSLCQLDVSELVQILGALRAQGVVDLHAHLAENPDLLAHMLKNMLIEQVNEHTVKMFGGSDPAEFVGPIARFWQGSEDTMRRSLAARYAGAEAYAEETRLTTLDGRVIDVFYTSAFPKALSELGIGLVGMIDIGDRLQAERMLQQVQADFAHAARVATLGELTASIAHEINQPLAAIATNGEASLHWLARPEPDVEEVRMLAARIVADARRAADVIARIRAMATGHSLERELISVNGAVEDALSFLRRELQSHDVTVQFATGARLAPVRADRTQIQQVLVNLAVNAIQAMGDRPAAERRLTVRTGVDANGWARIDVDDNGSGIPEAHVARLFDSFFTTKRTGLGIGLSICRSIIEAHGGRISCENLPGGGARFTVILPVGPQSEPRSAIAATHTKV